MTSSRYADILGRIDAGLEAARETLRRFTPGAIATEYKIGHDPVTEADRTVDAILRRELLRDGEGWLSEETADNSSRLDKEKVWIVDPLDGTQEFVQGIPEFCVSIGMAEDGRPVAGGIYNPATGEKIIGAVDCGVLFNGEPACASQKTILRDSVILASRSEVRRGEWAEFRKLGLNIRAVGSIAYKLGLVAVGLADLTFTLSPKHEWDIAAGAALVESAGGFVTTLEKNPVLCNRIDTRLSGLIAGGVNLRSDLMAVIDEHRSKTGQAACGQQKVSTT